MARRRRDVLLTVHAILEGNAVLVAALGHVVGAASVPAGARIIADGVRLEELPVPGLILSFDTGQPDTGSDVAEWTVLVDAIGEDALQAADLLDLVETIALEHTRDPAHPQPLSRLQPQAHQRLEAQSPQPFVIVRIPLRAQWA